VFIRKPEQIDTPLKEQNSENKPPSPTIEIAEEIEKQPETNSTIVESTNDLKNESNPIEEEEMIESNQIEPILDQQSSFQEEMKTEPENGENPILESPEQMEEVKIQELEKWKKILKEKEMELKNVQDQKEVNPMKRKIDEIQESQEFNKKLISTEEMIKLDVEKYEREIKQSTENCTKLESELVKMKSNLIEVAEKKQNLELKYNVLVNQMKVLDKLIVSCSLDEKKIKSQITSSENAILNQKINLSNMKTHFQNLKSNLFEKELIRELNIKEEDIVSIPLNSMKPRTWIGETIPMVKTPTRHKEIPKVQSKEKSHELKSKIDKKIEKLTSEKQELLEKILQFEEKKKKEIKLLTLIPENFLEILPNEGNILSIKNEEMNLEYSPKPFPPPSKVELPMYEKYFQETPDKDIFIDPFRMFCPKEHFGVCSDKSCENQHKKEYIEEINQHGKSIQSKKFTITFEQSLDNTGEILEKSRYFEAVNYQSSLEEHPNDIDLWIKYSFSVMRNDFQQSLEILSEALQKNRKSIDLWIVRDIFNISRFIYNYMLQKRISKET
jgi:hypothetical protein